MSEAFARGKIHNREQALVERDFSGTRWGKITPTDIDGFVEFSNRLFIFIEGKFGRSSLRYGQKLALGRLVDACHQPEKTRYAIGFVVAHDGSDCFDYAKAHVYLYRWNGVWHNQIEPVELKYAIDAMREKYLGNVEEYKGHAAWVDGYERHGRGES